MAPLFPLVKTPSPAELCPRCAPR